MDVDVRPYSRGIFKVCPVCNKSFYICEPEIWAYKMNIHTRTDKRLVYFNRYSCMRAYQKDYEKLLKKRKLESDKRKYEKAKQKKIDAGEKKVKDVFCFDCRYCMKDDIELRYCSCFGCAVRNYKSACKKYRPRRGVNGDPAVGHKNAERA